MTGPADEKTVVTEADDRAIWVHRPTSQADDPSSILAALAQFLPPAGDGFIWIAAERGAARALRRHVLEEMRHPIQWLKASGYWAKGKADASEPEHALAAFRSAVSKPSVKRS